MKLPKKNKFPTYQGKIPFLFIHFFLPWMSPFEYLQFGVCFVSFIFEQMSSFNVDSTHCTDVMIHWKRFFPRKWKENHDISNVWPFWYDRTINRSFQKLFSFDQTITKTNSNYTKSTYRSIYFHILFITCTTVLHCVLLSSLIYYIRVELIYNICVLFEITTYLWNETNFEFQKWWLLNVSLKIGHCIYFKCNGNIKWTIVVIFLSIIFLIVNSYSLESIEH